MTVVELYQSFSYGVPLPEIDARGAELAVYLRPYGVQFSLAEETRQLVQNMMGRSPIRSSRSATPRTTNGWRYRLRSVEVTSPR